jgi:hypothetical protein
VAADAATGQVSSSLSTAKKTITDLLVIIIPFPTTKAMVFTAAAAATYITTGHK